MTGLVQPGFSSPTHGDANIGITRYGMLPASNETNLRILLTALLVLVVLLLQFVFREFDNNRLLSWQWVMHQDTLFTILSMTVASLITVYTGSYVNVSATNALIGIVVLSFIMGMTTWSAPELMVDSARYFTHAKLISTYGLGHFLSEWGNSIDAWTDLPLVSVLYGVAFYSFGESRSVIQVINTLLLSGSIYITYQIGKQLWDERTGLYAAAFLLAIPFLHIQASQMLVDVPAMFFSVLAIYLSIHALKKTGFGWLLLASLAIVLALLIKYSVWIALSSIAALPFATKNPDRADLFRRVLLLGAMTGALLILVFYIHHPVILKQLKILLDYQLPALQRWQESYTSTFLYQLHPFVSIAALTSVYFAIKKKEPAYIVPGIAVCIMLIIGVYRARYLIIIFPMLTLMAAYALQNTKNTQLQHFIVGSAVAVSISITLIANLNFSQNNSAVNLKNAGNYLNSIMENNIVTVIQPQPETSVNPNILLPLLDYYTDKTLLSLVSHELFQAGKTKYSDTSPLRFTWELELFPYPTINISEIPPTSAIVLISGGGAQEFPAYTQDLLQNYMFDRSFSVTDNIFRFQSVITVYRHKANGIVVM